MKFVEVIVKIIRSLFVKFFVVNFWKLVVYFLWIRLLVVLFYFYNENMGNNEIC